METRKLIKFGNSSHVVSLPGIWIKKKGLAKGDLIYLEENGNNELIISSEKKERIKEDKSIAISTEGSDIERLNRQIISAYLNNYRIIKLRGKNLHSLAPQLKNRIQNLMGLEIIDQNNETLVAKDLLDLSEVALYDLLRRMDIIARAILSDLSVDVKSINPKDLKQRDENVNRLYFVAMRTIRKALDDPELRDRMKLNNADLFNIWHVVHHIEIISDEAKILGSYLKETKCQLKDIKNFMQIFIQMQKQYIETMKIFYNKDDNAAYAISSQRDRLLTDIEKACKRCSPTLCVSYERLKNIVMEVHKIGRRIYS